MNTHFANLSAAALRNLLIEESKKFNAAIRFGSPVSDLEDIQMDIREIEQQLREKESGEFRNSTVESIPPHQSSELRAPSRHLGL